MKHTASYQSISSLLRCVFYVTLQVVLLCACTDDSKLDESATTIHVRSFLSDVTDAVATRAIPTGYSAFDEPYYAVTADNHRIGLFLTRENGTKSYGIFNYTAQNQWTSMALQVKTGVDYYIYGFLPTVAVTGSKTVAATTTFADGATLTLGGIPAVTEHDICIVSGVGKGAIQASAQSIDDVTINPGNFKYQASYTDNYLYLLFNHLYSRVNIKFTVEDAYDKLRTVKLNRLQMAATTGSGTYTAEVILTANATAANPMATPVFTGDASSTITSATIFNGLETLGTTETVIPAYVCPSGTNTFSLTVRYDVYDKAGNLLTHDRQATNTFTLKESGGIALTSMTAGNSYELPVLVAPSFLYQISDADLNNPIIKQPDNN